MNELTGGIKNALERGENIELIKQSFVNAGYSAQDVEEGVQEAMQTAVIPIQGYTEANHRGESSTKSLANTSNRSKKGLLIGIILVSILLVCVGVIGLYWNEFQSYFSKVIDFFSGLMSK